MKLQATSIVEYLGTEQKYSRKTEKHFTLIAFGDPAKYERYEFFLPDQIDPNAYEVGDKVVLEFELVKSGYNYRYNLIAVHKARTNG